MAMESSRIPWKGWVVVCDGGKALMMRNDGDADLLNLTPVETLTQDNPPTRALGSDRPGRVHQSAGPARSAVADTDRHALGEVSFLSDVAAALDRIVHSYDVRQLLVVAPPRALGVLRQVLTPAVRAIVIGEIGKDLARLSTSDIERHLAV